jgi:hypothetical protein
MLKPASALGLITKMTAATTSAESQASMGEMDPDAPSQLIEISIWKA